MDSPVNKNSKVMIVSVDQRASSVSTLTVLRTPGFSIGDLIVDFNADPASRKPEEVEDE